jgi:hypothetical protein
MSEFSIPHRSPGDIALADRIRKLVVYVARNGREFEEKVKQKELNNPLFQFLFNAQSPGYFFYRWMLCCEQHQFNQDQVSVIEEKYCSQLTEQPPGYIDLAGDDTQTLQSLLANNSGSKECIKYLRKWVVDRAHSVVAIAREMRSFVMTANFADKAELFKQLLHTIYVVNDIFYNCEGANTNGPYTTLLDTHRPVDLIAGFFSNLPTMLRCTYDAAVDDSQKGKVTNMEK